MAAVEHLPVGPMTVAVREALDCVAAPSIRDQILRAAFGMAGCTTVPEDPEGARWFIEEPLRMALTHFLGGDAASAVMQDLAPVHEVMGSHARARRVTPDRQKRPSRPPAAVPEATVYYVTRSQLGIQWLETGLLGRARVQRVADVTEAFLGMVAQPGPTLVLLDADALDDVRRVARAFHTLADPPQVLLWGGTLQAVEAAPRWAHLPNAATRDDVVSILLRLL